jgi:hypothetical protein
MADLGGALEYLGGLQDLVANLNAKDEGSADVPGAYFDQPTTPPEPKLPPSQVGRKPDEKSSLSDDGVSEEDSEYDEVQARLEDDWWEGWLKRLKEFKEGGGKGSDKGSHKGSVFQCGSKAKAVANHKRSLSQCGSKAKAAAKVHIMPSSSEKASPPQPPQPPWRNKQQKIDAPRRPFPPAFPPPAFGPNPPGFAPPAYLIGPIPSGFPPGMQAPPPPPGYVEPPPPSGYYASIRKPCLVPPPPPPAVLPSQTGDAHWFRPTSKNKAMPKTRPPGGTRKNWEKQYRIIKEKSEPERLAFLERWPRPSCRNEDEIFSEIFRNEMTPSASAEIYKWCRGVKREYEAKHGSID